MDVYPFLSQGQALHSYHPLVFSTAITPMTISLTFSMVFPLYQIIKIYNIAHQRKGRKEGRKGMREGRRRGEAREGNKGEVKKTIAYPSHTSLVTERSGLPYQD